MKNLKIITFVVLISLLYISCSKDKQTFNKLNGSWKTEELELSDELNVDTFQLPTGGDFTFDVCSYKDNRSNQSNCTCSYKFNENNEVLDAQYQFQSGDVSYQTGYGLSIFNGYLDKNDTLNYYQTSSGGEILEISKEKLVFKLFLLDRRNNTGAEVIVSCAKK